MLLSLLHSKCIKNIVSIIQVIEMGIPFCKFRGFPKLSPCYVTNLEFLFKTSVISVEHCGPDGAFKKYYLDIFSLVIICLYLTECKLVHFKENYRHWNYVQAFL